MKIKKTKLTIPWHDGLDARTINCLSTRNYQSKAQMMADLKAGLLHPNVAKLRNFGWKSYVNLCLWAGMHPGSRTHRAKTNTLICPHCKKAIDPAIIPTPS